MNNTQAIITGLQNPCKSVNILFGSSVVIQMSQDKENVLLRQNFLQNSSEIDRGQAMIPMK